MKLTRNYTPGEWGVADFLKRDGMLVETEKGSWVSWARYITTANKTIIGEVGAEAGLNGFNSGGYPRASTKEACVANAALIAAAPDMVEALAWLAVELETLANTHGDPNAAYLLNESGAMAALKKAGVLE